MSDSKNAIEILTAILKEELGTTDFLSDLLI